jgi:hypothetical protein
MTDWRLQSKAISIDETLSERVEDGKLTWGGSDAYVRHISTVRAVMSPVG